MSRSITLIRTGPLALLQDAGRIGYAADGVGRSGAADRSSYAWGNDLLDNPAGATAIECLLGGLAVRAEQDLLVALTGAPAGADIDGEPVNHDTAVPLGAGRTLRLRTPRTGLRTYLAVAGGFDAPRVLGSASTDTLSQLGPPQLAKGDVLPIGPHDRSTASTAARRTATTFGEAVTTLRVVLGPRDQWFSNPADLAAGEWQVSPHSNRIGVRLDRPADSAPRLHRSISRELPARDIRWAPSKSRRAVSRSSSWPTTH